MVEDRFRDLFEGLYPTMPPSIGALRNWRPRLCLNFHGGTRSAWLTAFSGARFRAGFDHFRHHIAYNVRIPRAQAVLNVERKVHTAEHLASAMFYLGAPMQEVPRARLAASRRPAPLAVIHAVAATPDKTWPADRFLAVADHLQRTGLEPIFIGAAGDDLTPFRLHRVIQGAPLSDIKPLLASASLFVGNDSGPAHMAAAFGVPVVAIFGASDPEIWGPWRTQSEILSAAEGISGVATSQVLDALARLRVHA